MESRGSGTKRGIMPRVIGIDIPDNKRLEMSLTYIYGVGRTLSNEIIDKFSLNKNMRARELNEDANCAFQCDLAI